MEAVLLIGIQASGKTTFYQQRFFATHLRISLDLLRTRERERAMLETCLRIQQRFVVDNTNVTAAERARYILPSRAARFRVIGYFFEPERKAGFARNLARAEREQIPAAGFFGTLKRLEAPKRSEGFDELFRVWILRPGEFGIEPWDPASPAMDIARPLP
jgi:predicted kinase